MKPLLLFCLLHICLHAYTQTSFPFASTATRKQHNERLRDSVILERLKKYSDHVNEEQLKGAFWAMELMLYKNKFAEEKIRTIWQKADSYSESFQKSLLELSYTLYPTEFSKQIKQLLQTTSSSAVFVRASEYLLRIPDQNQLIAKQLKRFDSRDPLINVLEERINRKKTFLSKEQLQKIFSADFLPGETIIYSIQRANRNYTGLVLIRSADGKFVKEKGKHFSVSQLARAITNYPFYITNGNTPQGIYKWTGFDSSGNNYIGPTTNLQTVMPFEVSTNIFFPGKKVEWNKELYASLIPTTLQNHKGLYESFYAGQIGRSEIIMHGTTIDPSYYKGKSYYPNTPSMGCLCSFEKWSAEGRLIKSNQSDIVKTLKQLNAQSGFVVVIELNNKPAPVTIKEVVQYLK
jgi:hypothetical protein